MTEVGLPLYCIPEGKYTDNMTAFLLSWSFTVSATKRSKWIYIRPKSSALDVSLNDLLVTYFPSFRTLKYECRRAHIWVEFLDKPATSFRDTNIQPHLHLLNRSKKHSGGWLRTASCTAEKFPPLLQSLSWPYRSLLFLYSLVQLRYYLPAPDIFLPPYSRVRTYTSMTVLLQ
jgi:hypothetical protein